MATLGISNSQLAAHGLGALSFDRRRAETISELRPGQLRSRGVGGRLHLGVPDLRETYRTIPQQHGFPIGRKTVKPRAATEATDGGETSTWNEKRVKNTKEKFEKKTSEIRGKITDFLEKKSGFSWLLGPLIVTAAIVIPSTTFNLVSLWQKNSLFALIAIFGVDILFVIAADLFFVLADKLGHHQQVADGSPPWIGPWEYTGYPKGYPDLLNYIAYTSVGVGIIAIALSLLTIRLPAAIATFGPYLGLIFVQVAYERLLGNDRSPVYPLVPILYVVYRFRQLRRGLALLPFIADGSGILARCIHISSGLWALYLGMYLTQLPWLYSTWNSNRAT